MLDRSQLDQLLALLRGTCVGGDLVLVGSAAMYLAPTSVPPMTSDADFAIDTRVLANHLAAFLDELGRLGFEQFEDTATFVHADGFSMDLLGLEAAGHGDHVVRLGGMALLAFEDICRLVEQEGAVGHAGGTMFLAPAALVLSKLLTWRVDKGVKDKVQALAMIGDMSADPLFIQQLRAFLVNLPQETWEDVRADAQAAFAGLDAEEARGYVPLAHLVAQGLEWLQQTRSSS